MEQANPLIGASIRYDGRIIGTVVGYDRVGDRGRGKIFIKLREGEHDVDFDADSRAFNVVGPYEPERVQR